MDSKNDQAAKELQLLKQCCKDFDRNGIVYRALVPVIDDLQRQISDNSRRSGMNIDNVKVAAVEREESSGSLFPFKIARLGRISSAQEITFLYTHCTLLRLGFVCTVEIPSTVPGFAATIRGKYFVISNQQCPCYMLRCQQP